MVESNLGVATSDEASSDAASSDAASSDAGQESTDAAPDSAAESGTADGGTDTVTVTGNADDTAASRPHKQSPPNSPRCTACRQPGCFAAPV